MYRSKWRLFWRVTMVIVIVSLMMVSAYSSLAETTLKGAKLRLLHFNCEATRKMDKIFKELGAKYGFKVEIEMHPWMTYVEKAMLATEGSKSDYDVIITNGEWILSTYVTGERIIPLDNFVERDNYSLEGFVPWTIAYVTYPKTEGYKPQPMLWEREQGRLMGIPSQIGANVLVYRKDWFEDAGISVSSLETWDQFLSSAQKLTQDTDGDGKIDRWAYGMAGTVEGGNVFSDWAIMIHSWGADILDKTGRPAFNNQLGVEATQFWANMFLQHKIVPPGTPVYSSGMTYDLYKTGKIAMVPMWYVMVGSVEDPSGSVAAGKSGYITMPTKRHIAARANSQVYTIPRNASNAELSWEFIKLISSSEVQMKLLPEVAPSRSDALDWGKVEYGEGPLPALVETTKRQPAYNPLIPNVFEIDMACAIPLNSILIGESNIKEALDKAEENLRKLMDELGFLE